MLYEMEAYVGEFFSDFDMDDLERIAGMSL